MNKLTKDEVLHVAYLARLDLSEEEIEKFSYQLKSLFDEINEINNIKINSDDKLIAPITNNCVLSDDDAICFENKKAIIDNAPCKYDNFIEVAGVFDE